MPRSSSRLRAARPDRLLRVLVALSACASGCHCGGTALKVQDQTSVVIRTPADGSDGAPGSAVTFTAHAENAAGLLLLRLRAGQAEVGSCAAVAAGATALDCTATVLPKDHQADFANGLLRFTAVATAASGDSAQATADLVVSPDATVLAIDAPQAGTTRAPADAVVFTAHATNLAHLATLTLSAGADLLATCAPDPRDLTRIDCQATLTLQAHAAQLSGGGLVLSAVSTSAGGSALTKTVSVAQSQPPPPAWGVSFKQPALTQQTPPIADVHGQGPLELEISGTVSISGIQVTDEHGHAVAVFGAPPFLKTVSWDALGVGQHTITALATSDTLDQASAQRVVNVTCQTDAACGAGTRCCPDDGVCHPIGASGADCDCGHPCPLDQGCFPGTCGAPPQKCRSGCNPGSNNPARVPDTCPPENGKPAWCAPLPPGQATPQNHGGACRPADGCDVHAQNCPDLPLDRSRPESNTNPKVAYTCEPVSATATSCFPAGTHPPQNNNTGNDCANGTATCSNATKGCAKGYLCTSIVGHPELGHACNAQCNDPGSYGPFSTPPQSPDCAQGQYCGLLIGTGNQPVLTGICQPIR